MHRREFLKSAAAAGVVSTAGGLTSPAAAATSKSRPSSPDMQYRELGRTGEKVSVIGLGGFHIGKQEDPQESIRLIRSALDRGITFLDNCWDYNDGISEVRMGQALRDGYRDKAFLMTKVDGRSKSSAALQIEQSLGRLQTDTIDLVQFHECIRLDDPDRIFAPGGALEAFQAAKQAGKIRFIGFTGHKDPVVHLRMFEMAEQAGFHFDSVQMPLNVMDSHFRSFEKEVLPVALKHGAGVIGMKAFGDPFILESKIATPLECLQYPLNLPIAVQVTGIDNVTILEQALEAARTYKPFSASEMEALLARTREAGSHGRYELFKTSNHFDGTIKNPSWLG